MVIFVVTITLASVHLLIQCFTSFSHSSIGRNMLIDLPLHCMTMHDEYRKKFVSWIPSFTMFLRQWAVPFVESLLLMLVRS